MKFVVGLLLLVVAAGAGFIAGDRTQEPATTTVTRTEVRTETQTATQSAETDLPPAVLEKRDEILEAAESGDYDAVAALADDDEFNYSFGGESGDPAEFWRQRAAEGEDPLDALRRVLRLPYTLNAGIYVWPFAYDKTDDELTDYERRLLGDLLTGGSIGDSGYLGWRAGIRPDGRWVFFVAGD